MDIIKWFARSGEDYIIFAQIEITLPKKYFILKKKTCKILIILIIFILKFQLFESVL